MMLKRVDNGGFPVINRAYNAVFRANSLSLGLVVPLEAYSSGSTPSAGQQDGERGFWR